MTIELNSFFISYHNALNEVFAPMLEVTGIDKRKKKIFIQSKYHKLTYSNTPIKKSNLKNQKYLQIKLLNISEMHCHSIKATWTLESSSHYSD